MEGAPIDTYWDLFAGYTAFWLIVICYVARLAREQSRLRSELNDLDESRNAR